MSKTLMNIRQIMNLCCYCYKPYALFLHREQDTKKYRHQMNWAKTGMDVPFCISMHNVLVFL